MIGYRFRRKSTLAVALTHRSYRFENRDIDADNERLEFLGDAVLGFLAAAHMFCAYRGHDEGTLTMLRSRVTSGKALAEYALRLDLGEYLQMGQGEDRSGGRSRRSNLANAFEALIGAAYLDGGMRAAKKIFDTVIAPHVHANDEDIQAENPKGRLQELVQAQWKKGPAYRVISSEGPPHDTLFTVEVKIDDGSVATATGRSKQEAESQAALELLSRIEKNEKL
jgi:ribonuclease-3